MPLHFSDTSKRDAKIAKHLFVSLPMTNQFDSFECNLRVSGHSLLESHMFKVQTGWSSHAARHFAAAALQHAAAAGSANAPATVGATPASLAADSSSAAGSAAGHAVQPSAPDINGKGPVPDFGADSVEVRADAAALQATGALAQGEIAALGEISNRDDDEAAAASERLAAEESLAEDQKAEASKAKSLAEQPSQAEAGRDPGQSSAADLSDGSPATPFRLPGVRQLADSPDSQESPAAASEYSSSHGMAPSAKAFKKQSRLLKVFIAKCSEAKSTPPCRSSSDDFL